MLLQKDWVYRNKNITATLHSKKTVEEMSHT